MFIRNLIKTIGWAAVLSIPGVMRADDTDIYVNPNTPSSDAPLVMMSLDMRSSNLSSSYCDFTGLSEADIDGGSSDGCLEKVGKAIYLKLSDAETTYGFDYSGGVLYFDALRALFAALFEELEGVEIGFMVSHNEQSDDGGYILRGFSPFLAGDSNGAKRELLDKLYSIPNKDSGGGGPKKSTRRAEAIANSGSCASPASPSGDSSLSISEQGQTLSFAFEDVVYDEGDTATLTVAVSGGVKKNNTVGIQWQTYNGTAVTSEGDYNGTSGSESYSAGGSNLSVNETFDVSVPLGDDTTSGEGTEYFSVEFCETGNAGNCATVYGFICDLDGVTPPTPTVTIIDSANAGPGDDITFEIELSEVLDEYAEVSFTCTDGTATGGGDDYTCPFSPVTIPAGDLTAGIVVTTVDDADTSSETFTVELTGVTSAADVVLGADVVSTGTITYTAPGDCDDGGSYDHKFQGAELYYEMYRYLTGGDVLNGRAGDGDWGSSSSTSLDSECYAPPTVGSVANNGEGILQWDVTTPDGDTVMENVGGTWKYVSPITDNQMCSGIYAINILFSVSQQDNALNSQFQSELQADMGGAGDCSSITLSSSNSFADLIEIFSGGADSGDCAMDMSSSVDSAQTVSTYVVTLEKFAAGQIAPYIAAGANHVDGSEGDLSDVLEILTDLFKQILSVSTTFVSASVPVDVFNRASVNDNVFIALFTTDQDVKPLWVGNLKKLKLFEYDTGGFVLYDAAEAAKSPDQDSPPITAIGTDGRIRYDALTFWTDPDSLPAPPVNPADDDEQKFMESGKDGRFVARGAAGQQIPGFVNGGGTPPDNDGYGNPGTYSPRIVYTESVGLDNDTSDDDLTPIGTTGLTKMVATTLAGDPDYSVASALVNDLATASEGAISSIEARNRICWLRGLDDTDGDGDYCNNAEARSWLMTDSLHSRPVPINYGDPNGDSPGWGTEPDIRVVMGTNDGTLRMFQNNASDGTESGEENWAFMPRATMPNVKTLMDNTAGTAHPYGIDGPVVLLADSCGDSNIGDDSPSDNPPFTQRCGEYGDRAWIYVGMRRGGNEIYAMDVSDPDVPKFMWKAGPTVAGFGEMGLTFSVPTTGLLAPNDSLGPNPADALSSTEVVMFGGGYYGGGSGTGTDRPGYDRYAADGEDSDDPDTSSVVGNSVYIVNAATGECIWKAVAAAEGSCGEEYVNAGLNHSIAAPIVLADSDSDGLDDRAYVADMGGNLWRIDVGSDDPADWQMVKIAELGNNGAGGADDRRFMDRVDYVKTQYGSSGSSTFDAILLGSGDRAHPRDDSVSNYFFMIKDPNGTTPPTAGGDTVTFNELADANCFLGYDPEDTGCDTANDQLANNGWKLEMEVDGEKVLAPSITVANEVYFTTYLPDGEPGQGGEADVCSAGFEGTGRFYAVSLFNGYPVINQNTVDDNNNESPSSKADRFAELSSKGIPSEIVPLGPGYFIRPDLQIGQTSGSSRFRTFWYEKDVD